MMFGVLDERDRVYKFQQEMADRLIYLLARNPLATRFGVFDSFALANILRTPHVSGSSRSLYREFHKGLACFVIISMRSSLSA
jgi:hypothetical protein